MLAPAPPETKSTNRLSQILGNLTGRFSYDALVPKGRRKSVRANVPREDAHVRGNKHTGLQANAADLSRNLSLAGWMVRRHLDYVTQFTFHSRTDIPELDEQIERLMWEDSRPSRSDVAGRNNREKMFRLAETRRVLDGDTLLLKMNDGRLQGIQADLIRNPPDRSQSETWINGCRINNVGRVLAFGIRQRKDYNGTQNPRRVSSTNAIHYGFFDRYAGDQTRGVSPLVSALNPLRDVYENFDFALMKSKVSQIFGLGFYRTGEDGPFDAESDGTGMTDSDGDHVAGPRGFQAFVKSDLKYVDMEPGERVEVIESKTPSSEFQNFTQLVIQVSLKALDIPYVFYDESHTNFFGSRGAWLHYDRSCQDKRDDQREMRRNYTVWKYAQWIRDGRLVLPVGMTISELRFEWVARGMPWWDPSKEIGGYVAAIEAGLDTPQRVCRMTGTDFYDNVDEIAKANQYAGDRGVGLTFNAPTPIPVSTVEPVDPDDETDSENERESNT